VQPTNNGNTAPINSTFLHVPWNVAFVALPGVPNNKEKETLDREIVVVVFWHLQQRSDLLV